MPTLIQIYEQHKKLVWVGIGLLLLPFLLPLVNILVEIIFKSGQISGDLIRRLTEIKIC